LMYAIRLIPLIYLAEKKQLILTNAITERF
jgi:hypothetical protein